MLSQMTPGQLNALVITERVNSCLSLAGIAFVIFSYTFCNSFNKPINRLIFFASFGNMGSNIASLISEAGPQAGGNSALCQFQGFLVQMFLGVDCYWAFCMAVNVYLVFFRGYTTDQLRKLDLYYLLACYGLSFVPALVFVFITTPSQGHIYGNAIIWCWITVDRDWMRFVFLYGIVWLAILFAFIVYAMAAKVIWNKRRHLDGFLNPFNENPFTNTITTEIEITHDERPIVNKDASERDMSDASTEVGDTPMDPYSIDIHADPRQNRPLPAALRIRTLTRDAAESETNAEAWLYARVAFLFFFALLITWVPTSVNRVYTLVNPNKFNFPLNYVSSFVFPLQGFWNVIVYIITSQTACRRLWNRICGGPGSDYKYGSRAKRLSSGSLVTNLTGRDDKGVQRLQSWSSLNG